MITHLEAETLLQGHSDNLPDDLRPLAALLTATRAGVRGESPTPSAEMLALLAGFPLPREVAARALLPRTIARLDGLGLFLKVSLGTGAAAAAFALAHQYGVLADDGPSQRPTVPGPADQPSGPSLTPTTTPTMTPTQNPRTPNPGPSPRRTGEPGAPPAQTSTDGPPPQDDPTVPADTDQTDQTVTQGDNDEPTPADPAQPDPPKVDAPETETPTTGEGETEADENEVSVAEAEVDDRGVSSEESGAPTVGPAGGPASSSDDPDTSATRR